METTKKILSVCICTGFGNSTSTSWLLFTHHKGFDTIAEALSSLAGELIARFNDRCKRTFVEDSEESSTGRGEFDPVKFTMYVNSLARSSWGDYGDPDSVPSTGEVTYWWPFNDVQDIIALGKDSVLSIPCLGAEVLLAAHDASHLLPCDVREICEHCPTVAEALNLKYVDRESTQVVGIA